MTVLCFIDVETPGLDPAVHTPWEVCWWREDEDTPNTVILPHTLRYAEPVALEVNRYHEREIEPDWCDPDRWRNVGELTMQLAGTTLVGCNPGFDIGMLAPLLRCTPWHYRPINVADGAMFLFGWDRPRGLDKLVGELIDRGYDIPPAEPLRRGRRPRHPCRLLRAAGPPRPHGDPVMGPLTVEPAPWSLVAAVIAVIAAVPTLWLVLIVLERRAR